MRRAVYELMSRVEDDHWWYAGMRTISRALLGAQAANGAPLRVLDVGCGTGRNLIELGRLGQATGIDSSADAIGFAVGRGLTRLARGSADRLPFRGGTFDLVTAYDVLCHRNIADDVLALREMHRVLRSGGRLLLQLPAYAWLTSAHDRAVDNVRRYSGAQVRDELATSGFALERLTHANTLLFPLAAAKRLVEPLLPGARNGSDLEAAPGFLNGVLAAVLRLEARLLTRVDLPFGLTLVALARRP